jgi:hypothetical protein
LQRIKDASSEQEVDAISKEVSEARAAARAPVIATTADEVTASLGASAATMMATIGAAAMRPEARELAHKHEERIAGPAPSTPLVGGTGGGNRAVLDSVPTTPVPLPSALPISTMPREVDLGAPRRSSARARDLCGPYGDAAGRGATGRNSEEEAAATLEASIAATMLEASRIKTLEAFGLCGPVGAAAGDGCAGGSVAASGAEPAGQAIAEGADADTMDVAQPQVCLGKELSKARSAQATASAVVRAALEAAGATAGRNRERSPRARPVGHAAEAPTQQAPIRPLEPLGAVPALSEGVGGPQAAGHAADDDEVFPMTQAVADAGVAAAGALEAARVAAEAAVVADAAVGTDPGSASSHAAVALASAAMTSASAAVARAKEVQGMVADAKAAAEAGGVARASAGL